MAAHGSAGLLWADSIQISELTESLRAVDFRKVAVDFRGTRACDRVDSTDSIPKTLICAFVTYSRCAWCAKLKPETVAKNFGDAP